MIIPLPPHLRPAVTTHIRVQSAPLRVIVVYPDGRVEFPEQMREEDVEQALDDDAEGYRERARDKEF